VSAAPLLSTAEHIANLGSDGRRLGEVATQAPFDAPVPGCPGWDVEDLVRHIGDVHRWAETIVRERRTERLHLDSKGPGGHDELLEWYWDGLAALMRSLSDASPDDIFWSWAPAPTPLAFWARRQAHETAIHRLDAEQACGCPTPFAAAQAVDGIEEWLTIAPLRVKVADGGGRTLHLSALDVSWAILVEMDADGLRAMRSTTAGDCAVRGAASDLFALVMNRRDATGLQVRGDADVLRAWRESVRF
jgi:uncharacterized protein (TIGR03083 family)